MKTIRISDETHAKLTAQLGKLMAKTGKPKTYQDTIEALLTQGVILPQILLNQIAEFIQKNPQSNYKTIEEFLEDAVHSRIEALKGENKSQTTNPKSQH